MTLILYVNEVGYATRATHRPSFFVRMRFGEEGDASCATEPTSHVESTRSRRRSGAEEEAFLKRDFLKTSSLLSNMTTVAISENVSHFPELS